jgi:predicted NBD/HSP70 family sugar kinase
VFTENNATCSAAAEYYLGVGAGQKDLAYLSFNYGFGVGFFFDGDTHIGARGNAGEITSIFLPEEKDSRPALGKLAERLNQSLDQVIAGFVPNSPVVHQWLEDTRPQLRLALRAINAVADPGIIVFGGEAPEALRALLIEQAEGTFDAYRTPSPTLLSSKLSGDAAHLGAAFLPLHELIY